MFTGRCYCGACRVEAVRPPATATYCHCRDCRRLSGAPVAAFDADAVTVLPDWPAAASFGKGVTRWMCPACGSALAARYDYLPDQIYVPVGVVDDIDAFAPSGHSHASHAAAWLHIADDLPRDAASGRDRLNESAR